VKIKGNELQAFMNEAWPGDDWYWDHELFEDPEPDVEYDTDEIGPVQYQGSDIDPTNGDGYDLATLIRRWRRNRDYDVVTVLVPKGNGDAFKALMKQSGYKLG